MTKISGYKCNNCGAIKESTKFPDSDMKAYNVEVFSGDGLLHEGGI